MAISPAGAQGIAQFMPQTATMRGLTNAFEPLQALRKSASYLRELRTTFRGNLGLAAAAYNAGPGQVEAWLAGRRSLPGETLAYVRIITGHTAEAWASQPPPELQSIGHAATGARCVELAKLMIERSAPSSRPDIRPGVGAVGRPACRQLVRRPGAGQLRAAAAQDDTVLGDRLPLGPGRARRRAPSGVLVKVSENSRTEANALCAKLRPRAAVASGSFSATRVTELEAWPNASAVGHAGFQPAHGASALVAAEDPDLRIGEVPGDAWRDLQERAVGNGSDALDMPDGGPDKLQMLEQAGEAVPAGKRGVRGPSGP